MPSEEEEEEREDHKEDRTRRPATKRHREVVSV
jgi:hypothetical protein